MIIENENCCPICGANAQFLTNKNNEYQFIKCSACGEYEIPRSFNENIDDFPNDKDKLASYLYYNGKINRPLNNPNFFNIIGTVERFDERHAECPATIHVTQTLVDTWYPKSFSEKVDMFLLGLVNRANFMGEPIILSEEQLQSACFVIREPKGPMSTCNDVVTKQIVFFKDYLAKQDYIKAVNDHSFILKPKGLERIDNLQKANAKNTKNVFVAMSFSKDMAPIRETIKNAVLKCGYTPRIMDEIEHNHQIVPEMLHEIRESRFVIAELTGHNNGAYFEAGYALGKGIDIIQVCKEYSFNEDGHFDVKQVNTILWKSEEELYEKLVKRIIATVE